MEEYATSLFPAFTPAWVNSWIKAYLLALLPAPQVDGDNVLSHVCLFVCLLIG